MVTVVLTIHVLIVIALIGVVLLQRSEGGALGMGGGGGGGGFMTGRGAANALTRTTSILAALFFATSMGLAIFAGGTESEIERTEALTGEEIRDPEAPVTADDLFDTLGSDDDEAENLGSESVPSDNLVSEDAINELNEAIDSLETVDDSDAADDPEQ